MSRLSVDRIAIIGAGPSGVAAAKYFLAEGHFSAIDVFEQRSSTGGLWNYTPDLKSDRADADAGPEEPQGTATAFASPMYDRLETNIPHPLMRYADRPFEPACQLFPTRETVKAYLDSYAADVAHLIRFQTQVTGVVLARSGVEGGVRSESWTVSTRDLATRTCRAESYGAVVVASGHYAVPYIPDINGMAAWQAAHPGSVSHSKFYRTPADYAAKKVIVVGNSASGIDIGQQIAEVCAPPLLISRRSAGYFGPSPAGARVREVAAIQAVNCAGGGGTVQFVDGQSEAGVDAILFCTGYLYAYPFLAAAFPQHAGLAVVHDGSRVQHTYEHLLFASHPSLAFLALPHKVVPFQLAQAQAAVLARLYAGRLPLPAREAMRSWESDTLRQRGPARAFHMLAYPLDADYMRMLADWAATADDRTDPLGRLVGMPPPRWGPWECWARERFTLMRQAFRELGPARAGVRTLDDLGFVFRL